MPVPTYNYAQAFLCYCQGTPLNEVAEICGIPLSTLRNRAGEERWAVLREEAPKLLPVLREEAPGTAAVTARLDQIKANRAANYENANELREDLVDAIGKLRRGEKLKQYFFSAKTCTVVEKEVEWSVKDRLLLAQYAETIARMSYQALGDQVTGVKTENGPANSQNVPRITVILPGLAAEPREKPAKATSEEPSIDV